MVTGDFYYPEGALFIFLQSGVEKLQARARDLSSQPKILILIHINNTNVDGIGITQNRTIKISQ